MTLSTNLKPRILNNTIITFNLLFYLIISQTTSAQNNNLKTSDSLKNKSYEEYASLFYKNQNDSITAYKYANLYLTKAKKEKDIIRTANAYSLLATLCSKPKFAIKYSDSIINLTKNIKNNKIYPTLGYIQKGMLNEQLGNYYDALDYYITANKLAVKNKNYEQTFYIKNQIGQLKLFWGDSNEALNIFKSQLYLFTNNKEKFKDKNAAYYKTLFNLSNAYILNEKLDSALFFSTKGLNKGFENNDLFQYNRFLSQTGEIFYYKNELKKAYDSIIKAFPFETSYNAQFNNHFILGNIFKKQHNEVSAYYHFSKADSIYNLTMDVVPEVREIQEYFINYYKLKGDIKNQLKYINRLLHLDSIIHNNHLNLNETIFKKYDTPLLLAEKQELITHLKEKEKKTSFIIYGLVGILLIIFFFSFRFFKNQRTYKKRFKKLLFEQKKEIENNIENKTNSNELHEISKDIVDAILFNLKKFEKNNGFINNQITLANLATDFNTNSRYLSKIINVNKQKNFSTYIADLRIEYCIKKLKEDITFRKYSVKAISSEIGFNNAETFSKAFYKKTGIYPSYFIKEIEK
ncbi:helix-turn-helix domain-containing protein [Lutibacter maritimus]|uniref:AraC-type DNA-binding protein n=1 Tax=Lutibacter maritimus TaxID=593133 RepID=A0A1I6PSU9_9FLAO|nr:helix-turn-helix domain-containing protein [Lutibacter maritimus]SFS43281.1 AraC-type DNA-binding protein [Lutibacter maritimus]